MMSLPVKSRFCKTPTLLPMERYDILVSQLIQVKVADNDQALALNEMLAMKNQYPWGRICTKPKRNNIWGLKHGDRLILGGDIRDIFELDSLDPPYKVWFFRQQKNSCFSGCPLVFNIPGIHKYGIEHFELRYFRDCVLHTLDLGIIPRWLGHSLSMVILENCYGCTDSTEKARLNASCDIMRAQMKGNNYFVNHSYRNGTRDRLRPVKKNVVTLDEAVYAQLLQSIEGTILDPQTNDGSCKASSCKRLTPRRRPYRFP